MNIKDILNNKVPAINKEVTSINAGGCGAFALALWKWLKAKSVTAEIVLVSGYGYTNGNVESMCERLKVNTISEAYQQAIENHSSVYSYLDGLYDDMCNGHVGVLVDGVIYDSTGAQPIDRTYAISDGIEPTVMEQFLKEDSFWNDKILYRNGLDEHAEVYPLVQQKLNLILGE